MRIKGLTDYSVDLLLQLVSDDPFQVVSSQGGVATKRKYVFKPFTGDEPELRKCIAATMSATSKMSPGQRSKLRQQSPLFSSEAKRKKSAELLATELKTSLLLQDMLDALNNINSSPCPEELMRASASVF